jgi:hypothetical protein
MLMITLHSLLKTLFSIGHLIFLLKEDLTDVKIGIGVLRIVF